MAALIRYVCLAIIAVFLCEAPAGAAERIITVPEVMNRVKIRHRPDLDSPAIGSLNHNESAELLESLPYWYHIRLDNGVPGYISRAWTCKLSDAEGDGEVIRIGYWKIGPGQGASDYRPIVQTIESTFDVLAVSGLAEGSQPGYGALLKALGKGWAGLVGPGAGMTENAQPSAILYRTAIVRPCEGWKNLVSFETGGSQNAAAPRGPVFGCFEAPTNKSSMGVDFILGVYSAPDAGAEEAKKMGEQIDAALAAVRAAYPMERDIFLAGTFNVSAPDLQDVVDARVKTKGSGSTLDTNGELTGNLYDHILIADEQSSPETIDAARVLDVRSVAGSNQKFCQTCSDHLPVQLLLRTTGPDDD